MAAAFGAAFFALPCGAGLTLAPRAAVLAATVLAGAALGGAALTGAALTAADAATAELAIGYWSAFAKTGNPNGDSRPIWPAYDTTKDQILDFANSGAVAKPDPWRARLDLAEHANNSEYP